VQLCAAHTPKPRRARFRALRLRSHYRLSNWLVNKAKENPKTVQGILGHSRTQTTLDLYTDEDLDEMIAAQEKFIDAVGFERETVQ
jgi:integrase